MPLRQLSKQQVIEQLESGNYWLGGSISYSFPQYAISTYAESAILNAFSPIPDPTRPIFRLGFNLWDDLIPQQIKEIPQSSTSLFTDSDIEVAHFSYSVSDSFAFAYYPDIGSVWFNSSRGVLANPLVGNYGFFTVLHELGHALGLNHMGDYNGSSAYTPFSYQDSTVLSIMSYFGPSSPLGNNEVMQADWVGGDGQRYYVQTPMVNDVLAIQKIYGRSGTTRTGNTTYGFNTNLDENDSLIFDFAKNLNPILTIFDSSGNADWIDLSGWSTNSFLDLRAGSYSSANEMTNNIAIAFEVIIENGVTGNGNDTLIGNSAANYLNGGRGHDELIGGNGDDSLEGGSGDDYLDGGRGSDTAIFNFSRADYTVNSIDSSGIVTITSSQEGTDRLERIELFSFSDGIHTIETISASLGAETSSDKLAPTLLSVSPEDNAKNVASGVIFEFTFSEPIQRGSGDLLIYNADGTLFRAISVNNTAQVLISGSMITLKLAEELSAGSSYYINIGPGVIKDQAGNFFAGVSDSTSYNFSTRDLTDDYPWSTSTSGVVNVDGALASGRIEVSDDKDLFRINLVAGNTYTLDAVSSNSDGLTDPYLYLYSPDIELLETDDDSGEGVNAQLTYTATTSGIYYVGVSDYGSGIGNYQVQVSTVLDDYPWSTSTSGVVNVDGALASGRIEVSDDKDLFRINLVAGNTYTLDAVSSNSDGLTDPYLYLYSPDIELLETDDDSGEGVNAQLTYTATTSGTYYVGVSDYGSGIGSYTINLVEFLDVEKPTLLSVSPEDNANNVASGVIFEFTFSEPIQRGSGDLLIYNADGTLFRAISVNNTAQVLISGSMITLKLAEELSAGSSYYINIGPGVIKDQAGNFFAGVSDSTSYNFSTRDLTDDYPWSTSTSGVVNVDGALASGRIEVSDDKDLFRINLVAGNTYTLDAVSSNSDGLTDPYLYLYSPDIELLETDDDSGEGVNAQLTYTATTSGIYYVGVSDYGSGIGNYQVQVSTVLDDYPWSTSTSGVVNVDGALASGRIEVSDDKDFFRINLVAGNTYTLDAVSSNSDGLTDPYLYLYSPDIELLETDDDSGEGVNAQLTYTATTSGIYYVGVSDYGSGIGNYQVQVSTVLDDYPWSTSTSGVVNVDGALASGRIEVSDDKDLFRINLVAGNTYTLDAVSSNSDGLTDPYLYLYSPDIELLETDDDSGEGVNAQLTYTATTSGIYYVGVSDYGSGIGNYQVQVSTVLDDYPWSTSTSGVVNVDGALASGRIEVSDDKDLFRINLVAGNTYTLDAVSSNSDGLTDPYLYLYSPDIELLETDDDSGEGVNAQLTYTATTSGIYYVGVSDYGSGIGNYQVQASISHTLILSSYRLSAVYDSRDEGSTAYFSLVASGIDAGTVVAYTISGISASDLVSGSLNGTITTEVAGKSKLISIPIRRDNLTEGAETLTITLDDSSSITASLVVNDTSKGATYSIAPAANAYDEGQSALFSLVTTNLDVGTSVAYTLSGVSASDLVSNSLAGTATVSATGTTVISLPLAADALTEGTETLTITLDDSPGTTASLTVLDTSMSSSYRLSAVYDSRDEGSTAYFSLVASGIDAGTVVAYTISGISASDLVSGSLNGTITTEVAGKSKLISIPIRRDNLTEGAETLTITLDDSSSITASLVVNDTSKGATYSIAPAANAYDEGQSALFSLVTTNLDVGTSVFYTLSGVSASDLVSNSLAGTATVSATGTTVISLPLAADALTEGTETLTITLDDSPDTAASLTINDSSKMSAVEVIVYRTTILGDRNILGPDPVLIKALTENITKTDGVITEQFFLYAGARYDYSDIDSLITVVTRNGEFTDEFSQEISDYASSFANATYSDVVKIVGSSGIDGWLVKVAGDDGNYIG